MRRCDAGLVLLAVALAACGGDDGGGDSSAQPPSRYGLAPSPITPLADQLTDIAFAALRGQPLPQNGIMVQPAASAAGLVRQDPTNPMFPDQVSVIAFAMEVDIVLRHGAATPYGGGLGGLGAGGDGALDTLMFLTSSDLRLGGMSVRGPREALPLPPQLMGISQASTEILGSLRDGSATLLTVNDGDRLALGADALYNEIADDRPDLPTLERAKVLAMQVPQPLGYRVDDAIIVTKAPDGRVWSLGMDFEHGAGGVAMLESSPLVRVRRFGSRF